MSRDEKDKRATRLDKDRQARIERQAKLLKEILRASKELGGHSGHLQMKGAAR